MNACGIGPIATFVPADFKAAFPVFSAVPDAACTQYFNFATVLWNNSGGSQCSTLAIQQTILNFATAHLLTLYYQSQNDATPGSPKDANTPVGRVASATQGSVTVSMEMPVNPSNTNQAWWLQTQFGATFWAMTAQYRNMRYIPGRGASMFGYPTYPVLGGRTGRFPGGRWGW